MEESKYIKVSRDRFYDILSDSKYQVDKEKSDYIWTSCPEYTVVDLSTNEVVGSYTDGSYVNSFHVIHTLASKEDIISFYEEKLNSLEEDFIREKNYSKKLKKEVEDIKHYIQLYYELIQKHKAVVAKHLSTIKPSAN